MKSIHHHLRLRLQKSGDKWFRDKDGKLRRSINKIDRLFDVSPVFEPAYEATSCSRRKLDEIEEIDTKLDALKREIEEM